MSRRSLVVTVVAALVAGLALSLGSGASSAGTDVALERQARAVTRAFIRSLNERRYDRTCALLAESVTSPNCEISLRAGLMWSQEIRFRISAVRLRPEGAIVEAVADGAPGRLLLVRRGDGYRVLRLTGP